MARFWFPLAALATVGLMVTSITVAQGQTKGAPGGTQLSAAVKGEFKTVVQNGVVEMESGGRVVYVKLAPTGRAIISGKAEPSFLAPKMFVKIPEIEANALGETKGAIKAMSVVEQDANTEIPTFYTESASASLVQKKLTKEESEKFNKYFVRGSITKITGDDTDREIQIKVPNGTVTAKVAPDCKIDVISGQPAIVLQYAQSGDGAEVREGKEFAAPMPPGQKAPAKGTAPAKGAAPAGPQPPRLIESTWFEVTAKNPLAAKKKPGAKK